ncbi:hypothetical protein [Streptomyces dangxiongensis]|nr:hypothetical protein [Streptomyces dangxiongensis]
MAEEQNDGSRCARCERRRSIRQAVVDWLPVIAVAIKEVVRYFSS